MNRLLKNWRGWRATAGALAALAVLSWAGAAAFAQEGGGKTQEEPDWPCPQKYVADLSWGAIWAGPDLTPALDSWHDNDKLRELITLLADDTTSEHEAITAINAFADSVPEGEKKQEMTELFAGLFETMANQRTSAQSGIKRFFRRQQEVAERVNAAGADLRELDKKEVAHDTEDYVAAKTRLAWANRIYDERQILVPYMCEVPVVIERRLGTYARAIQGQIEGSPMEPPPPPGKS